MFMLDFLMIANEFSRQTSCASTYFTFTDFFEASLTVGTSQPSITSASVAFEVFNYIENIPFCNHSSSCTLTASYNTFASTIGTTLF
nr:hypothetical protein [Algoriphagus sp.]